MQSAVAHPTATPIGEPADNPLCTTAITTDEPAARTTPMSPANAKAMRGRATIQAATVAAATVGSR